MSARRWSATQKGRVMAIHEGPTLWQSPLTLRQALRLEGWTTRLLAALAAFWFVVAAVNVPLMLIIGVGSGSWRWGSLLDSLSAMALASVVIGHIYWRRRALVAERESRWKVADRPAYHVFIGDLAGATSAIERVRLRQSMRSNGFGR